VKKSTNLNGASVVTHYQLKSATDETFASTQSQISNALAKDFNYDGAETYTDPSGTQQTLVRHFRTAAAAKAWLTSDSRQGFEDGLTLLCASPPISNILLPESGQVAVGATSVITTRVKAGSDLWFAQWQGRIGAAQQQFPGYVGQRVQAPIPGVNPNWVAIVAFDTAENLRSWDDSAERKALVAESSPYIERYDSRPANSAFESWFASSENGAKPPPAWKLTSIVLLVLYPVVMLEILTINKFMAEMHLAAAISTFIGNAISVALTGFLLIPWASRALRWWLVPPEASARKRTALGAGLIIALYALCVLIFALLINWDPALL
jgi:antibiotic biosynthesis monooxygenase (ABM) superfamily enzyme